MTTKKLAAILKTIIENASKSTVVGEILVRRRDA
jgi:hypothetical protein